MSATIGNLSADEVCLDGIHQGYVENWVADDRKSVFFSWSFCISVCLHTSKSSAHITPENVLHTLRKAQSYKVWD